MAEQLLREPQLLLGLIGDVTIGESYFFRLKAHFGPLITAARRVLARADARFCVWSAGCAAGEEPYSIAWALRDALLPSDLGRVTIVGTDVDRSAIASAETAIYGPWSFRGVDAAQIERGFRRLSNDRYELLPELRRLVTFRHYPLREHLSLLPAESLNAIFYRNVSVYLGDKANESMYEGFARVLRPGGLLFVAPTDIRPKVAVLRTAKSIDGTIFERIDTTSSSREFISKPPIGVEARSTRVADDRSDRSDPWRRVDQLADAGDLSGALQLLAKQSETQKHSPAFHKRRGRLHLAHGDAAAAVADFRRVLYLLPEDNPTRYWYALALRNVGQYEAARHQLRLILSAPSSCDEGLLESAGCLLRVLPEENGLHAPPPSSSQWLAGRPSGLLQQSDGYFDAGFRGKAF